MKTFEEQNYSVTIEVKVSWAGNDFMIDEIKGLNVGHAMYRAADNWEGAAIEFIKVVNN